MQVFYHGSSMLFGRFDLAHILEGDGKVKFGYGVYLTSSFSSAAHYSGSNRKATPHYVYTVEVPDLTDDNHIDFKKTVPHEIVKKAEQKLGECIPHQVSLDAKGFRKYLAKKLYGELNIQAEKAASSFLKSIGVNYITWPYSWKNPTLGINVAVLDESIITITRIQQVELDYKQRLIGGSETDIALWQQGS